VAGPVIRGFRAALSFLTTLPVWIQKGDYDCFAQRQYLFVPAGLVAGLFIGVLALVFQWLLPVPLAAILVVACVYLLTGINHVDGLCDFGDGLVTSGSVERKEKAMKDVHAGAGGVLFVAMDLVFLYVVVSQLAGYPGPLLFPLLIAEVCAKVAMVAVIAFGNSTHQGMGAYMIAHSKKSHLVIGLVIAWVVCLVSAALFGVLSGHFTDWHLWAGCIAAMISPLIVTAIVLRVSDTNFGGVNGDVIGATNEITRIVALFAMGAFLWMRW
jgi:adenosylcobinamide-GDP ribazoletransferase